MRSVAPTVCRAYATIRSIVATTASVVATTRRLKG